MGIAFAALFILLNGFFVAAEFALVKVRATRLHSRAKKGERRAIVAEQIVTRLDRYLSVTQFGITLASLGLGWVGEPAVAAFIHGPLASVIPESAHQIMEVLTVVLAFTLLTFAHVLFGELVPKLIAIQRSEQTALVAALPLRVVYVTFRPFLWTLEAASGVVLRMMGLKPNATSEGAPPRLTAALRCAVFPGGARLRPALTLAVAGAWDDPIPALSDAAAVAVELLHCASLVHDDLPCFDNASTRRGLPTSSSSIKRWRTHFTGTKVRWGGASSRE